MNHTRILDAAWPEAGVQGEMLSQHPDVTGPIKGLTADDFGRSRCSPGTELGRPANNPRPQRELVAQLRAGYHGSPMRLTHLALKNWRNFKHADFDLQDQVLLTTHSEEVLQDPGLGKDEVVVLRPGDEGTEAETAASVRDIQPLLDTGLSLAEIPGPKTEPREIGDLPSRLVR
ncbi:MAG: hypothetical protein OXC31_18460 [Spirochaetaceae bacterium]|nr:hypothetical protein [Spirochaetaceae bacterium]